jgi:NAD(P)-dependent dehydrogenase (short-subunit alcohol dehydrogenase family)
LELASGLQTWNAHSVHKTIVVTGAAGGLGIATTAALVAAGHRVVGVDLRGADEKLDVTDPAACRALARRIMPDVWINNAGILGSGHAADQPDDEIRRIIEVNLLGVIWGSRAATEIMRPRGSGHVINIGSLSSWITPTGETVYAASKHGVRAFTVGLAAELTGSGLHVSLVCPDGIWTPMLYDRLEDASAAMSFTSPQLLTPEGVAAIIADVVAKPRLHVMIPRARGFGARLVGLVPDVNVLMTRILAARGRKVQAQMVRDRAKPESSR